MTAKTWLRISIPIQGLLLLSQLITGLNFARIPWDTYKIVHLGGGILLTCLVAIHVILNRDWFGKEYHLRLPPDEKS